MLSKSAGAGWSDWQPFPDPCCGGILRAPFGPGVYQLRNRATGKPVLFGRGKNVAHRMSSLVPAPLGTGTRNNADKRVYVQKNLASMEYRTYACRTEEDAAKIESELRASRNHLFNT